LAALAEKPLEATPQESSPPDVGSTLPGRDEKHGPLVGNLGKLAIKVKQTGGVDRLGRPQAHLT
jgi:hypothetical protein